VRATISQSCHHGFTLIELLVVIAIISLLAAMLLPVVGHANMVAKQSACMSNMKQIGIATFLYCDDNHGHLPEHGYNLPQISLNRGYAWGPHKSVGWWLLAGCRYETPFSNYRQKSSYTGMGDKLWRCPGRKHIVPYPPFWAPIRELADYALGWSEMMPAISPTISGFPNTELRTCDGGPWIDVKKRVILFAEAVDPHSSMALSGPFYDIPHLQNGNILRVDGAVRLQQKAFSPALLISFQGGTAVPGGNNFMYPWEAKFGAGWWIWAEKKEQGIP